MREINEYAKNTGFGAGANRFKIEEDGTAVRVGDVTTWDDLVGSLTGKRLSSTSGKVAYDYTENAILFLPGGSISTEADIVNFNFQYPHAAIVDGIMALHIHWEQPDATEREFTLKYRVQKNSAAKNTTWTTVVIATSEANNVFPYVSGVLNQITPLADVDMTDAGISATVQFQLARTDGESGDIRATFVDAHIERDTDGSRSEYVK